MPTPKSKPKVLPEKPPGADSPTFELEVAPPALLSLIDLTAPERKNFIDYSVRVLDDPNFEFLGLSLLDSQLFRFLDVFAGETIRIPTREETLKFIEDIQVYTFISRRVPDHSERSSSELPYNVVSAAAINFSMKRPSVKSSYDRVRRVISSPRKPVKL